MGRFRLSEPAGDLIAWLGLILMASAFLILTMTREPSLPRTSFPYHKKTEPFALVILAPIIVNIVAFHIYLSPDLLPVALLVAALELFLAWYYRAAFAPLFKPPPPG